VQSSHEGQTTRSVRDDTGGEPGKLLGEAIGPEAPTEIFPWEAMSYDPTDGHADQLAKGGPGSRRGPSDSRIGRRKFVALLAAGTVGAVTVVTVGGISFARSPHQVKQLTDDGSISTIPLKERDTDKDGDTTGDRDDDGDGWHKHPHKKPKPTGRPKPTQTPSPTKTPQPPTQPSPTSTPTKTPTPTGTVIGSSTQATNTAVSFTNPADGQASWLVHMSNGNFVAVEQACTHAGVAVKYNPTTGQFNCPAHGAIFNADGTNPQAPATRPLPPVHITVNANGTITTP
jgi:Rieske Fe-S protein